MKKEVAVNGAAEEDGIRELANWLIEHRHRGMEETPPSLSGRAGGGEQMAVSVIGTVAMWQGVLFECLFFVFVFCQSV